MIAPKFSVAVPPDSVVMSAEKRPGAPEVLVTVLLRCTVISSLASTAAIMSAMSLSCGIGRSTLVPLATPSAAARPGMRLCHLAAQPPSAPVFSTMCTGKPAAAVSSAAVMPVTPPPTTRMVLFSACSPETLGLVMNFTSAQAMRM